MSTRYQRQVLLFDPSRFEHVVVGIVGLGNIGSHAALALTRLGIKNFVLWDPDTIEVHNVASQAYQLHHVGEHKAHMLKREIKYIEPNAHVSYFNSKFSPASFKTIKFVPDIVLIAVDSMKERKRLWNLWKHKQFARHLIDARIGGEQLEIYNCPSHEAWGRTIVDGSADDPCGGRYIAYVSAITGGLIANQVKKVLNGEAFDTSIMVNANNLDVAKNFSWHENR